MTDGSTTNTAAGVGNGGNGGGGIGGGGAGRRPRERAWVVAAALVAVLAAAGYTGWRRYARPVDPRFQQVADLLTADPSAFPLKDYRGCIDLAARYPGLTPHDEMFVARRPDGLVLALFPTYYGNGTQMAALLYASRPLGEDDTYMHQPALGRAQRVIDVASYAHMNVDRRLDDHWYRVSYLMQ